MFKFLKLFGFSLEFGLCLWDVGSALSIGSSVVGGLMGNDSADQAAKQSAKATAASNAMLKEQAATNTANYSPYINVGTSANNKLADLLGLDTGYKNISASNLVTADASGNFVPNADLYAADPSFKAAYDAAIAEHNAKYKTSPNINKGSDLNSFNSGLLTKYSGLDAYNAKNNAHSSDYGSLLAGFTPTDLAKDTVYNTGLQFGLDQGNQALNRQAAATGSLNSGATLKALTKYANDYGTTKAAGAYERFNNNKLNTYNMLSGQQGIGLNATNGLAGNNTSLMIGQANNTMTNGTNQANAAIAGNSATTNAINGGIGNYLFNKSIAGA